jgi:hypothetical protein
LSYSWPCDEDAEGADGLAAGSDQCTPPRMIRVGIRLTVVGHGEGLVVEQDSGLGPAVDGEASASAIASRLMIEVMARLLSWGEGPERSGALRSLIPRTGGIPIAHACRGGARGPEARWRAERPP